ncbi:DUF3343 domain-containing protein [Desulfobacter sp.]|uniref:DUF3343 domain-containing protein n=1 Tax=Desulfobacter sp. TaxID=2294 RepID=UPI000E9B4FEB|nr:DUF3343 domain-containing protein [Desulfobacter sp.]HBT88288.1 hypothetical protein [Desulfobacter sp.]
MILVFKRISRLFNRTQKNEAPKVKEDLGILVFENTSEVIQAENFLKSRGWEIKVMGPPPGIQSGCDLVIQFPLIERLMLTRQLEEAGLPPLDVVPVTHPLLKPVDLFHTKDFGDYLMVRAANMKLTIEKKTKIIVNISGGGCPDVPYLAREMVGRHLDEAPRPGKIGHTLCGYALELAHKEMIRQCS